jgi:hypothetical protein
MKKIPAVMQLYYQELDLVLSMMETSAFRAFIVRWKIKPPQPPVIVTDKAQWLEEALRVQMRYLILSRPTFTREQKDNVLRWLVDNRRAPAPDPDVDGYLLDWLSDGHQATVPTDPAFPNGRHVHTVKQDQGQVEVCQIDLPYPAPECGRHRIICRRCALVAMIPAAGRPDDPTMVTLQCKKD